MKKHSIYISILIATLFFTSCEDEYIDIQERIYWQVYEQGGDDEYQESLNIVGEPTIPNLVSTGGILPGSSFRPLELPWEITGSISIGILSLDFPIMLGLSNNYGSDYTDGVKIARVHIKAEESSHKYLILSKQEEEYSNVLIYYTDQDFTYQISDEVEIQLKAGWNFWDKEHHILSQNLNVFFSKGYRWHWVMYV